MSESLDSTASLQLGELRCIPSIIIRQTLRGAQSLHEADADAGITPFHSGLAVAATELLCISCVLNWALSDLCLPVEY